MYYVPQAACMPLQDIGKKALDLNNLNELQKDLNRVQIQILEYEYYIHKLKVNEYEIHKLIIKLYKD